MFLLEIISVILAFLCLLELLVLYKDNGRLRHLLSKIKKYAKKHGVCSTLLYTAIYVFRKAKSRKMKYKTSHKPVQQEQFSQSEIPALDASSLNIGILLNGGIGDFIILANYIHKFRQKFSCPNMRIDTIVSRNFSVAQVLIGNDISENLLLLDHDTIYKKNIYRKYDLFLDIDRYPMYSNKNLEKIQKYNPSLLDYCLLIDKQRLVTPRFFSRPMYDGQNAIYAKINGKKRITQADIGGRLGMSEIYEYLLPLKLNSSETLEKFGLSNKKIIAVISGFDFLQGSFSNKVWPVFYYNKLLQKIKDSYPDYFIVQMGTGENAVTFTGVDLNLQGKTTFEETEIILQNAALLIGNEGGMIHLRHALHGGTSIVLFSSTDKDFFGYSENININGNGCQYPCEWFYKGWQEKCVNQNHFACVWSLTPNMVFNKFKEWDRQYEKN